MKKATDIISITRSDNLLRSILKKFDSVYAFCVANNLDYPSINKYINRTMKIGNRVAKKLEMQLDLSNGGLDAGLPIDKVAMIPLIKSISDYQLIIEDNGNATNLVQITSEFIVSNPNQQDLCVLLLNDESMKPTISEGSQLIVDLSKTEIISNKVYALNYKNKIIVRRIQQNLKNNTLVLIPDANTYNVNNLFQQEELLASEVKVIGRVIYRMGLI